MAIVWPSGLPQKPTTGEYSESAAENWIRSEMDSGPAKVRLKTTANVRVHRVGFEMTEAETETFDTFYQTTTTYGTAEFEWAHPRTGDTENWRFASVPQYKNIGGDMWVVSFDLEQIP